DGRAWLSVVPFVNVDLRPAALPRGAGFALPELNLRTYVRHRGRPGVYFFSLDADGALGVLGARLFHHLPYYFARIDVDAEDDRVTFASRRRHPGARPVAFRATYGPDGERFEADRGSLSAFLTARDRYYTEDPSGATRYATVEHERWPLYPATARIGPDELFRGNWFDPPEADPTFLYSPGVDTVASTSRRAE
ncbi:MAG: YqjF family protein, partial [Salinigranum sp.]